MMYCISWRDKYNILHTKTFCSATERDEMYEENKTVGVYAELKKFDVKSPTAK